MKKILITIITLVLILPINIVSANEDNGLSLGTSAKSVVLMEASTGEIIYQRNANEKLHPASMTKMMSMLLIMEAIEKGNIKWNDMVTASENASSMGGSQILLETGEKMSVDDLFKGIAIASGNDAVVALAEKVAGTEESFVKMMNDKAKELGLKNTNFKNPHGLDATDHYSSAYDMAMIGKELVKHEKVLEYSSIYEYYLRDGTDRKTWLVNTNKLVRFYDGVDGLKTGYTKEAGYCLTATAFKNGMRIIAVVMGEPDSKTRNKEVTELLDYAYAQYDLDTIISSKKVIGKKAVNKGKQKYAELILKEDATSLIKKGEKSENISYEVNIDKLNAPIKVGDVVGELTLKKDNKIIKNINITVKENIEKANFIDLYLMYIKDIISGEINLK